MGLRTGFRTLTFRSARDWTGVGAEAGERSLPGWTHTGDTYACKSYTVILVASPQTWQRKELIAVFLVIQELSDSEEKEGLSLICKCTDLCIKFVVRNFSRHFSWLYLKHWQVKSGPLPGTCLILTRLHSVRVPLGQCTKSQIVNILSFAGHMSVAATQLC